MSIENLFVNSLYLAGTVFAIMFSMMIIFGVVSAIKKQKQKDKIDIANYQIIANESLKKTLKDLEEKKLW